MPDSTSFASGGSPIPGSLNAVIDGDAPALSKAYNLFIAPYVNPDFRLTVTAARALDVASGISIPNLEVNNGASVTTSSSLSLNNLTLLSAGRVEAGQNITLSSDYGGSDVRLDGAGTTLTANGAITFSGEEPRGSSRAAPSNVVISGGAALQSALGHIAYSPALEGVALSEVNIALQDADTRWTIQDHLRISTILADEIEAEEDAEVTLTTNMVISNGASISTDLASIAVFSVEDPLRTDIEEVEFGSLPITMTADVTATGADSRLLSLGLMRLSSFGEISDTTNFSWEVDEEYVTGDGFTLTAETRINVLDGARVATGGLLASQVGSFAHSVYPSTPFPIGTTAQFRFNADTEIRISGQNSVWENSGDAIFGAVSPTIGNEHANIVATVQSNSAVTLSQAGLFANTGDVVLARDSGSSASLTVGSTTAPVAAGSLNAAALVFGAGSGTLLFNHTETDLAFDADIAGGMRGAGVITQQAGRTILSRDSTAFSGTTTVSGGQLQVNGSLGGQTNVESGGQLEGRGHLAGLHNAGLVAPGLHLPGASSLAGQIGTLTVLGDYVGAGGILALGATLGDDASATDRLVVNGNTAGETVLQLRNIGGTGAQTREGIQVVQVDGASLGTFALQGDYVHEGAQAVVAGAYAYKLFKGGTSTPEDGDWYLRTFLLASDVVPTPALLAPLYQPGVPVYETYPVAMLAMSEIETRQQRNGTRVWDGSAVPGFGLDTAQGAWLRITGAQYRTSPESSATVTRYDQDRWKLQAGVDMPLMEGTNGDLVGSLWLQSMGGTTSISSPHGNGKISTDGLGLGMALTWYGLDGFYVDGQAQFNRLESRLKSELLTHDLAEEQDAKSYGISIETGKRFTLRDGISLTPQLQLSYTKADIEGFNDRWDSRVEFGRAESLTARLGVSIDQQRIWQDGGHKTRRLHTYGIANIIYELKDDYTIRVSGTDFAARRNQAALDLGVGSSYSWDNDIYTIYGEIGTSLGLKSTSDQHGFKANLGFRMRF